MTYRNVSLGLYVRWCRRVISAQDPQDQVVSTKEGQRAGVRDKDRR